MKTSQTRHLFYYQSIGQKGGEGGLLLVLMVMFVVGVRNDEFILCIVGRKTRNEGKPTISPDIVLAVPHAEGKDNEKQ
jgi:hypothetical protein